MVEVTPAATQQIAEYFNGKEVAPIRIFLNEGGWGGPSLAMALDESNENDEVFDIDGFSYIVNKNLLEKATPIKVDFSNYGFRLDCSIDFGPGGCGGCGSASEENQEGSSCCG